MPTEEQLQIEIRKLLDDIHYINQANKLEARQITNKIRQRIAGADLPDHVTDAIIDEVSAQVGQNTAQVKLTEKALRSITPEKVQNPVIASLRTESKEHTPGASFGASQFANTENFLSLQTSQNGTPYLWSSSDPEICFSFSLDRSRPLGMQIRLYSLIKPEYSKQLRIYIDGTPAKHWFHADDTLRVGDTIYILSCNIPPAKNRGKTEVKIVLPATHSPVDLGISSDGRQLGLAINEVCFGKAESAFSHLLRRLHLKS